MMIRTQVYLTENEHKSLQHLTAETGKSQSALIRLAIDNLINAQTINPKRNFKQAAGMWANRKNLPDFTAMRHEFDRR